MKIDRYNDAWKKELGIMMIRMANLSNYQPMIVNPITLSIDEQKLFNKRQEDYYLFEAGLLYIFSQPLYIERILSVFNNLTYKQKLNFYTYYESFNDIAIKHGFLTEYSQILKILKKDILRWKTYIEIVAVGVFLLLIRMIDNSFFITLSLFIILYYLIKINSKLGEISIYSKQTDLIVQKLNSDLINSDLAWAKEKLTESGWLNKSGKIISIEK